MQGPKRHKAITGRPQSRGYVHVCAVMFVFMYGQLQSRAAQFCVPPPFTSAAALTIANFVMGDSGRRRC